MKKAFLVFLSAVLACSTVACKAECQHVYDSDLDTVCNECGETREVAQSVGLSATEGEDSALGINEAIASLDYNAEEILAFKGNTVEDTTSKSGSFTGDTYVVTTRGKQAVTSDFDLAVPSGQLNVTYPGALLLANSELVNGEPQQLAVDRGSVTLTLNLPGMTNDATCVVSEASCENVLSATNEILNRWHEKYSRYTAIPSDMSYTGAPVYDRKTFQLQFGCNAEEKLGIDFGAVSRKEKSVYLLKYKQAFYTASVQPFGEAADAFSDGVTVDDLCAAGMNDANPPAYVENVVYGREVYVKLESNVKEQDLIEVAEAIAGERGVAVTSEVKAKYSDVMEHTTVTIVALGGEPLSYKGVLSDSGSIKQINNAVFQDTTLSQKNPAYPLSCKVAFLKDNSVAKFSGSSEYIAETYEEYSPGTISLEHTGTYTAKFEISWDEVIGYDDNGNELTTRCSWDQNGEGKTAGFKTVITLGGNCRNINIEVQQEVGFAWSPWQTILEKKNLDLVSNRVVRVSGTALSPEASCSP